MESFPQQKTPENEATSHEHEVAKQHYIEFSPEHIHAVQKSIASIQESKELGASINKVTSRFSKLSKSIFSALAFSVGMSASPAEAPEANVKLLEMASEKIQIDIQNFAKQNGFIVADVKFKEKDGEWVIHVGQTHSVDTYEHTLPTAKMEVLEAQTKIEKALIDLKEKKNISSVYVEAFTEDSVQYKKELDDVCRAFDDIPNTREGAGDANMLKNQMVAHYGANSRLSVYTEYSFFKKFMFATNEYNMSEQKARFYGAIDKLFCDRIIEPLESERTASNAEGMRAMKKYFQMADQTNSDIEVMYENAKKIDSTQAQQIISQALRQGINERELYQKAFAFDAIIENIPLPVDTKSKFHALGQALQDYAFFTLNNREYVALERIAEQSKKHQPQLPHILVFGSGHQFGNSLDMWNQKHPERIMNYIRLEIKSSANNQLAHMY